MTRGRVLLTLLAALALLAAAVSWPAQARSSIVRVPLPSAGDITLAHVVFDSTAASARTLPRFRLASAGTRRLLRRYRVAVIGGSFRLGARRVVGSVLLMRGRGPGRVRRTPRAAVALVAASAPVVSATVERNAIADLRRERARASGEQANAPTACGETGLFTLLSGDTLPPGGRSFGLYYNNWDRLVDFSDPGVEHHNIAESIRLITLGYGIACGLTDRFDAGSQVSFDDFLADLGATGPGPDCSLLTTYVGPATDGEGHILTQPSVSVSIRCTVQLNGVTLIIPDHTPNRCTDSAGHDCMIEGFSAGFPFPVPAFEDRSFGVTTDPPLMHGDLLDIIIESDRGDAHEHQVM